MICFPILKFIQGSFHDIFTYMVEKYLINKKKKALSQMNQYIY